MKYYYTTLKVINSPMTSLAGIIAIIFSVMSSSSADRGDVKTATTYGKVSLALSIIGQ